MVRGNISFKCDECHKIFVAPDIEYGATVFSMPMRCPHCGSYHSYPLNSFFYKPIYKKMWKKMDAQPVSTEKDEETDKATE